jgi:hypothetical protein
LLQAQSQVDLAELQRRYPVQAPTWVVVMQDFGRGTAPEIPPPPTYDPAQYVNAWAGYDPDTFVNYGRLPRDRIMINWPQQGNDYGVGLNRLVASTAARQQFHQAALWHSQGFARFIQEQLGRRYGLAHDAFPTGTGAIGGGAYALQPYYRESRRLVGMTTVTEPDILPTAEGMVAALPCRGDGAVTAIALGNYANDHHYPGWPFSLVPKSIVWGGRWTGTPFTIPYDALVPAAVDGLLACDKNISVSHIANGATRLQPVVLAIGQAAGMAAALCVEQTVQPRDLNVRSLQDALIHDPIAPAAVIPLFDLLPHDPDWATLQTYYLDHPEQYPLTGYHGKQRDRKLRQPAQAGISTAATSSFIGNVQPQPSDRYQLHLHQPLGDVAARQIVTLQIVTLHPEIDQQLRQLEPHQVIQVWGRYNPSGNWLIAETIQVYAP